MGAIDIAQKEIIPVIDHLSDVSKWVHGAIIAAKDLEFDLKECEDCDYGPDERLQNKVEAVVNTIHYLSMDLKKCEPHLHTILTECGWDIDFDEDRDEYKVFGPCEDDRDNREE
jgi:hypothetical protein